MGVLDRQLFRLGLVAALGSGLAFAATQPGKPKIADRERPAPIILAVAVEHIALPAEEGRARVDQCSLNPHDYSDNSLIGDKTAHKAKKRKVVVCG